MPNDLWRGTVLKPAQMDMENDSDVGTLTMTKDYWVELGTPTVPGQTFDYGGWKWRVLRRQSLADRSKVRIRVKRIAQA